MPLSRSTRKVLAGPLRVRDADAGGQSGTIVLRSHRGSRDRAHTRRTSMRTIVVLDYDPTWPEIFERLRSEIWPAVSDVALAVEHVGSTSVPGLAAKPIIDMSVVVPTDAEIAVAIERLATLGYVHRGNLGVEGREAFRSPDELPPHHLYLCPRDSIGLANHLAVRDYLRTHPEMATEYGALKKRLAREYPHDIDRYIDGKTDLILGILRASNFPAARLEAIERTNRMSVGQGGAPADSARRE